jgi:hypothetical protein
VFACLQLRQELADVAASKQFDVDSGLAVAKHFGSRYVQFAAPPGAVTLALYRRGALAKAAGVSPDGSGSHRIVSGSDAGPFTGLCGRRQTERAGGHGSRRSRFRKGETDDVDNPSE